MKKAIEFQNKCLEIYKTILSPQDVRITQAQTYLAQFQQNLNDK